MANANQRAPLVTGLFPDRDSAERAYQDLSARGYNNDDVNLVMADETRKRHFSGSDSTKTELGTKAAEGAGVGAGIGGTLGAIAAAIAAVGTSVVLPGVGLVIAGPLAAALVGAGAGGAAGGLLGALIGYGIPEETVKRYEQGIKDGGILMAVKPRTEADTQHFTSNWPNTSPTTATTATTAAPTVATAQPAAAMSRTASAESGTIPVIEEQLEVGKRQVETGTVHVTSHVVETPVNESVTLREEHANIERRPVERPATEADLAAFKEEVIEVRQTAEKAVVGKTARVVEEVVVGKTATTNVQQVSDTVRRTVVEVEHDNQVGGAMDFRSDFETRYAGTNRAYDDVAPAYRYGATLASDQRYANRSWDDIETGARSDWQTRYPNSTWDESKAAVRHGWEKVTGKR
jgi:uncharacterized protein (TIGR02271 family)